MKREKYYFHQMEDSRYLNYNWLQYGRGSDFTDEEIKNGKWIIDGIEYTLFPLSQLKKYLKEHPNEYLYENCVEDPIFDEETKEFLKTLSLKK